MDLKINMQQLWLLKENLKWIAREKIILMKLRDDKITDIHKQIS